MTRWEILAAGIVPLPVPRAYLLEIADALAGAVDADDAGHRFYHWESPWAPRPCSSCRETRDADDAQVDAARVDFLARWVKRLGTSSDEIECLLNEYRKLPRKALR